jgi:hypothetical protein
VPGGTAARRVAVVLPGAKTLEPDPPVSGWGHRFADDGPIERLSSAAAFGPASQRWGYRAAYLTNELILAATVGGLRHLLIRRTPLRPLGEVIYPDDGEVARPEGQRRSWPVAAPHGTWLTRGPQGLHRWVLPPHLAG